MDYYCGGCGKNVTNLVDDANLRYGGCRDCGEIRLEIRADRKTLEASLNLCSQRIQEEMRPCWPTADSVFTPGPPDESRVLVAAVDHSIGTTRPVNRYVQLTKEQAMERESGNWTYQMNCTPEERAAFREKLAAAVKNSRHHVITLPREPERKPMKENRSWTEAQKTAMAEHRLKVFYVDYSFFESMFDTWQDWGMMMLGTFAENFRGSKVVSVFHNEDHRAFGFVLCNPEFPIAVQGEQLPRIPNSDEHIFCLRRVSEVFDVPEKYPAGKIVPAANARDFDHDDGPKEPYVGLDGSIR